MYSCRIWPCKLFYCLYAKLRKKFVSANLINLGVCCKNYTLYIILKAQFTLTIDNESKRMILSFSRIIMIYLVEVAISCSHFSIHLQWNLSHCIENSHQSQGQLKIEMRTFYQCETASMASATPRVIMLWACKSFGQSWDGDLDVPVALTCLFLVISLLLQSSRSNFGSLQPSCSTFVELVWQVLNITYQSKRWYCIHTSPKKTCSGGWIGTFLTEVFEL